MLDDFAVESTLSLLAVGVEDLNFSQLHCSFVMLTLTVSQKELLD